LDELDGEGRLSYTWGMERVKVVQDRKRMTYHHHQRPPTCILVKTGPGDGSMIRDCLDGGKNKGGSTNSGHFVSFESEGEGRKNREGEVSIKGERQTSSYDQLT